MEIDNLMQYDSNELLKIRAKIDAELSSRGISVNVGDLGEYLAIEYFNSTPGLPNLSKAPTGVKNVDALSRDGDRYSIKSFLKAKKTGEKRLFRRKNWFFRKWRLNPLDL